jgi:hypothetical protein
MTSLTKLDGLAAIDPGSLTGAAPREAFAILSGNYDLLSYIGNDPACGVHRHVVKMVDRPRDRVLLRAKLRLMVPCSIVTEWVPRSESFAMVLQHATLGHNMGDLAARVRDVMPSDDSDAHLLALTDTIKRS